MTGLPVLKVWLWSSAGANFSILHQPYYISRCRIERYHAEKKKKKINLFFFRNNVTVDWARGSRSFGQVKNHIKKNKWISKKSWETPGSTIHAGLERAALLCGTAVAAEITAKIFWCHLLSAFSLLWADIFSLKLAFFSPQPPKQVFWDSELHFTNAFLMRGDKLQANWIEFNVQHTSLCFSSDDVPSNNLSENNKVGGLFTLNFHENEMPPKITAGNYNMFFFCLLYICILSCSNVFGVLSQDLNPPDNSKTAASPDFMPIAITSLLAQM